MTDNVELPGTGGVVATKDIGGSQFQQVIAGAHKRISVTPTISTSAYAAGDAVGGKLTFSNAGRYSGAGGRIKGIIVIDLDQERAPLELVLFNQDFGATADNAAFDPSDGDLANIVAVVPVVQYFNFNDNSVGFSGNLDIEFKCATNDLVGQLLTRGAPTYSTSSDIIVILLIEQE